MPSLRLLLAIALFAIAGICPGAGARAEPTAQNHSLDAADVSAFFGGLLPYAIDRGDIPGAVIVVVKDGSVLFAKGYGYADLQKREPVDPAATLFWPGSISKTVTWTAVMQLAQAGKIDLDRDINAYLDFHIPDTWPKPITMRNLMTHTAGFEDVQENIAFTDAQHAPSNEKFLKEWIPARIFPPGKVYAYSNYGAALAGYIVQRVSGEPFETYVERNIFAPLGMRQSTFRQPLPAALTAHVARGYGTNRDEPEPFETIAPAPAGAMTTTGLDMARFMIAHLQYGRLGNVRILNEDTARRMYAVAFRPSRFVNGAALGFRREDRNGQTIIGHTGDTLFFHSDLHLYLNSGVGVFISMNGGGANGAADALRQKLLQQFTDRYFPRSEPAEPTLGTAFADGKMAEGRYESTRRSGANFWSFVGMLGQDAVSQNSDGTISITELVGVDGKPLRWREVAPFVWREVNGGSHLSMRVEAGRIAEIVAPPLYVFLPVPWWRNAAWNEPLLLSTVALLAFFALQWLASPLLRHLYGAPPRFGGVPLLRYRAVRAASLSNLIFLAGIPLFLILSVGTGAVALTDQLNGWLRCFQIFGWIGAAGTGAAIFSAIAVWRGKHSLWVRISESAAALAGASTLWFALAFHLLSLGLHF